MRSFFREKNEGRALTARLTLHAHLPALRLPAGGENSLPSRFIMPSIRFFAASSCLLVLPAVCRRAADATMTGGGRSQG